ncbi:unnamed protein product [Heligmosomoides polygyrus]|uniref:Secreted protein n=1 Tax=Heligmosomoides polygyrus TaxID=6339 RepID=A0A183G7B6_HELPZ|nr:unnamed protein product [Heligmosomoides polygyrus]
MMACYVMKVSTIAPFSLVVVEAFAETCVCVRSAPALLASQKRLPRDYYANYYSQLYALPIMSERFERIFFWLISV